MAKTRQPEPKYAPQCPHCKRRLPRLRSKFNKTDAIARVLSMARSPKSIRDLARAYAAGTDIARLSARRAVERLAKSGHLIALGGGMYRTSPMGDP